MSLRSADIDEPAGYRVAHAGADRYELLARGHIGRDEMVALCSRLDEVLAPLACFALLIDARELSGFDLETRAVARAWSRSPVALRGVHFAVVAASELSAAESPLVALAVPSRTRLFGSHAAALRALGERVVVSSGTFPVAAERSHTAPDPRGTRTG